MDSPSPTQSRKRAADGPGRAGGKRLRSDTLGVRLGNLSRSPTAHDHSETLTAGNRADPRIHEDGSIRDVQDSPSDMKDYTVSRHSGDTAHRPKPRCVRISGIPKRWSDTDLIAALQTFDPSLEGRQHDISMYPACCGDTQTALLNSNTCAEIVERRQSKQATHIFNESSGSEIFLAIDSHFNDLTPLNRAESIILADVVAVTGLAGHAFGSWRNRNTYKMWLKDFLPEDVLGFRIMTYGYNSNLVNDTVDDEFLDYRRRFIHTLQNARRGAEKRPIIFVGHSMGGILILQALLQCNNGRQYKHLFAATRAILFFGMPHQGMEVEELRAMVKDVSPLAASRLEIIQQLEEGSNFLNTQKDDITNLWDAASEIEILSFYETKKTVTVGKSATGSWGRSGEKVNMVKKNSAQLFWPWEHRIPVSSDHTEIVKFSHREDTTYQDVVTHMIKWKESIEKAKKAVEHALTEEHAKILDWIYPYNTNSRHNDIGRQRLEETGKWFLQEEMFSQWFQGSHNLLWAHGIPGAGKTFISSLVIDHLQEHASASEAKYGVIYIYFNYKEQHQQRPIDILASLVRQLGSQNPEKLAKLKDLQTNSQKEKRKPTEDELYILLVELSKAFTRVFVVFDALDECDRWEQRERLLPICHRMGKDGFLLFVTGRQYADDIQESFRATPTIEIKAHQDDIRSYTYSRLGVYPSAKRMIQSSKREEEIITKLVKISAGMFLFVRLNLEHLCRQPSVGHIMNELKKLENASSKDKPLDSTYDRIMESLNEQPENCASIALNALCWLSTACRTLTIDELRIAVSIMPDTSQLDEDFIPHESVITDICAGLVVMDKESGTVRLAHFTVQEYLIRKNIVPPEAHSTLAISCTTYLGFNIFGQGACTSKEAFESRLASHPFLNYAAPNLAFHLQSGDENLTKEAFARFLENTSNISSYLQVLASGLNTYRYGWYVRRSHALHIASRTGHILVVHLLIENGADVSAADDDGCTPLYYSVINGHEGVSRLLIEKGADVSAVDNEGSKPLHHSAYNGHEGVSRLLIEKGADVSAADDGWTPLHHSAYNGHEGVSRLLIEKGADVSAADDDGWTPLHHTARYGYEGVSRLLIEKGADVSAADGDGWTPLHYSANNGYEGVSRLLIGNGADVSAADDDGWTPLHHTARYGHEGVSRLLIEKGADVSAADDEGSTPLHYFAYNEHEEVPRLLIEKGADVSAADDEGSTPLHHSAYNGHEGVSRLLIEKGADASAADNKGSKPLHHSARYGYEGVSRLLIEKGADVSAADDEGWTPLHYSATNGHEGVSRLLIDNGADVSVTNKWGATPLQLAVQNKREGVV